MSSNVSAADIKKRTSDFVKEIVEPVNLQVLVLVHR